MSKLHSTFFALRFMDKHAYTDISLKSSDVTCTASCGENACILFISHGPILFIETQ